MAKTQNDKSYERGVKDGLKGNLLDDICHANNIIPSTTNAEKTYDKGYVWGAQHRHDPKASGESSDKGSSSSKSSSSGGCYITTACADIMGLADDCLELTTLRGFRDRILMPNTHGRKAVREYYNIAPGIVKSVNMQGNALQIWSDIYNDIRKAVSFVAKGDFEGAFRHYQEMTLALKNKYLD